MLVTEAFCKDMCSIDIGYSAKSMYFLRVKILYSQRSVSKDFWTLLMTLDVNNLKPTEGNGDFLHALIACSFFTLISILTGIMFSTELWIFRQKSINPYRLKMTFSFYWYTTEIAMHCKCECRHFFSEN